jgi:starch phosphorylase
VRVESVRAQTGDDGENLAVGTAVHVVAKVRLGELSPADVIVQAYHGPLDADHQVTHGETTTLLCLGTEDGACQYEGDIPCSNSGLQGFSVRVSPMHPEAELPQELPLITWE